ncbi:MAG: quinone-dependent dihydroorotate dehydrogenase [Chitinophagaceae bacterium]
MYKTIRDFLFRFDPEKIHHLSMNMLQWACSIAPLRVMLEHFYSGPDIPQNKMGLLFKNPVGLAAGFDKNAAYLRELETLGFGFVEIGTVTPMPQEGNEKPRLFRLPADLAIINRMGFNNDGMHQISMRLKSYRKKYPKSTLIIGGNIGKNKNTSNENAWMDYEKCFRTLYDSVDYFVVNVSSPNTPGLRELQEAPALRKILMNLQKVALEMGKPKPLLLKIAPDLTEEQISEICELALELHLDGLVVNNTTISRNNLTASSKKKAEEIGPGGLSGKPLQFQSDKILSLIADKTKGKLVIIGSGGIFTAIDANEKFKAGADLIQVWTGFIYEGPSIVKNILKGIH